MTYFSRTAVKLPLLRFVAEMGGNIQFSMYGEKIETQLANHFGLSEADRNKIDPSNHAKGQRKWRNEIQCVRARLIKDGWFIKRHNDYWSISERGYKYLAENATSDNPLKIDRFKGCFDDERVIFIPELKQLPAKKSKLFLHRKIELNCDAAMLAKQCWFQQGKRHFECERCKFSFWKKYGNGDHDYIESHLLTPREKLLATTRPRIDEIQLVCSNCHSLLHNHDNLQILQVPKP